MEINLTGLYKQEKSVVTGFYAFKETVYDKITCFAILSCYLRR